MKPVFSVVALVLLGVVASAQTSADLNEGSRLQYDSGSDTWSFSWWGKAGRSYFPQHSTDLKTWTYVPIIESGADAVISWGFSTTSDRFFTRLKYSDAVTGDANTADFDGDGLGNLYELNLGIDPFKVDTDGDLLWDGYEDANGSNPNNPDSDGDGSPDGQGDADQNGTPDGEESNFFLWRQWIYEDETGGGTVEETTGSWERLNWPENADVDPGVFLIAYEADYQRGRANYYFEIQHPQGEGDHIAGIRRTVDSSGMDVIENVLVQLEGTTDPESADFLPNSSGSGFGERNDQASQLHPLTFEIVHIEKERDADGNELATVVNPGRNVLLRDEIAELVIRMPPILGADWNLQIDVEPSSMASQVLGDRGSVQMWDIGVIDENGNVDPLSQGLDDGQGNPQPDAQVPAPYHITLPGDPGGAEIEGEEVFRIVMNKAGKFRFRVTSADSSINLTSQEFTVVERMRKYGKDIPTTTYDFNKYDQYFEAAAETWGAFYLHTVDTPERLKAIGMTESELGRLVQDPVNRPNDIMTIGHPQDHVLDILRFTPGHQEKEVDPQNTAVRDLNYPEADMATAEEAILWGVCWLYHKAQRIANNPEPPPTFIPGPWRSWADATERYNGGGVSNYLERVTNALEEGRQPTDSGGTLWPILTNGEARK